MTSASSTDPMSPMNQAQRDDLQRDVHAALEARRELGPSYDDHFAQQLTERMMAQVRREMVTQQPKPVPLRTSNKLDRSQRTAVAICSLIFGIPLIAIGAANGLIAMICVIALIAVVNLASAL